MSIKIFTLFLQLLFMATLIKAQSSTILEMNISVDISDKSIRDIIIALEESYGFYFSYDNAIKNLEKKVSLKITKESLATTLQTLFKGTSIGFKCYQNQIILVENHQNAEKKKYIITGTVVDDESNEPVQYASIQFKGRPVGTFTSENGMFEFEVLESDVDDTLLFSSFSYDPVLITAATFTNEAVHKIYLTKKAIELPVVNIKTSDFRIHTLGNEAKISLGSVYIDTHGQQTALFIANKRNVDGIISSVRYYLSSKGNTNAPFRVRLYSIDTATQGPGKDLLSQIVVVKPKNGKGWFEVDLSSYGILAPSEGFFVAMEGIFPGDYEEDNIEFDVDTGEDMEEGDFYSPTISYGQRLGYTKKRKNNTWHYSLSHTWFQLEEKAFSVMIAADIKAEKRRKKRNR